VLLFLDIVRGSQGMKVGEKECVYHAAAKTQPDVSHEANYMFHLLFRNVRGRSALHEQRYFFRWIAGEGKRLSQLSYNRMWRVRLST